MGMVGRRLVCRGAVGEAGQIATVETWVRAWPRQSGNTFRCTGPWSGGMWDGWCWGHGKAAWRTVLMAVEITSKYFKSSEVPGSFGHPAEPGLKQVAARAWVGTDAHCPGGDNATGWRGAGAQFAVCCVQVWFAIQHTGSGWRGMDAGRTLPGNAVHLAGGSVSLWEQDGRRM